MRLRLRLAVVLGLATLVAWPAVAPAATRRSSRRASPARRAPAPLPSVLVPERASVWDQAVADAAKAALGRRRGAVVAMDPRNGRVLAVVAPELAVGSAYQPCSVFKIVVAVAGLSDGAIKPDTLHVCHGGCWLWPGHGAIDLRRALAVSCNPYFEQVGERLGYGEVQRYAHLLGLGEPTGINLEHEATGRVPAAVRDDQVGHLSSHAAGITTSPLQLAVLISAAINGGVVYRPQLAPAEGFVPQERWRLPAGTVFDGLAEGFLRAVNEGSATSAFDPDVTVAGKTGTCARVGWFASYAPADAPEIVIVTFLRPGSGHSASALAGRIYQALYASPTAAAAARQSGATGATGK
jgi:penicillin-binding protein 2